MAGIRARSRGHRPQELAERGKSGEDRQGLLDPAGQRVDDEVLAHISPAHSANINFFGAIEVDIEGELAQLGPTGYRPLRVRDTLF
ncbi:hypothetical protein [Nocardia asiatica]|uniref:hypothetical protein n=1 Tax=Nocardia asiatica TaxID=209252 RepID=UPI0005C19A0C|nr:hypothetical protein [Nocardia asiatica]